MRRTLALGAALAVLAGCGSAGPLVTADQLVAQCGAFKGKTIRLAGYIAECAGYACPLYPDKAGLIAADKYMRDLMSEGALARAENRPTNTSRFGDPPPEIGIGQTDEFDRKAVKFQNSYVVISGRVSDTTCTGAGGTDRSAGVEPTDIRTWTPAEGAPANSL